MRFNLSNKSSFKDFQNFVNQFQNEIDFVHDPSSQKFAFADAIDKKIKISQGALDVISPKEAQAIYLHEVGHLANDLGTPLSKKSDSAVTKLAQEANVPLKMPENMPEYLFKHYSEFRSDAYAGSMMGNVKAMKSGLTGVLDLKTETGSYTHPAYNARMNNLDKLQSVIEEVGQDKSIPDKLASLSKEDRRLVRRMIPFEVHSARHMNQVLKEDLMQSRVNSLLAKSSTHRTLLESLGEGKPFFEQLKQLDEGTLDSPPSWYFGPDSKEKMELGSNYGDYQKKLKRSQELRANTIRGSFVRSEKGFASEFEKIGLNFDDSIDTAIARSIERIKSPMERGRLPIEKGSVLEASISATRGSLNTASSAERVLPAAMEAAGITARRSSRN